MVWSRSCPHLTCTWFILFLTNLLSSYQMHCTQSKSMCILGSLNFKFAQIRFVYHFLFRRYTKQDDTKTTFPQLTWVFRPICVYIYIAPHSPLTSLTYSDKIILTHPHLRRNMLIYHISPSQSLSHSPHTFPPRPPTSDWHSFVGGRHLLHHL